MRKLLFILSISSLMVFFSSCFGEIDNWYTETAGYDGRYSVAISCEEYDDDDMDIEDGEHLMIYNSSANVSDEIVIDVHLADEPIKGKFKVSGDPSNFKGQNTAVNVAFGAALTTANMFYAFSATGGLAAPPTAATATSAGLTRDGIQIYARLTLDQGNITPNGKTTIGGNKSDGVLVKVTLLSDYLLYETYQTNPLDWADPNKPEFAWRVKEGSRENAEGWEEHWKMDGYRYTGYPEDDPNTVIPIVVK